MEKKYFKLFTEIRFPVVIQYFSRLHDILESYWPDPFDHWTKTGDSLKFYNGEKPETAKDFFICEPKRLTLSSENNLDDEEFIQKAFKMINKMPKWYKPKTIERAGVRSIMCITDLSFQAQIQRLQGNKIFKQEFLGSFDKEFQFKDVQVILEGKSSRLVYGPMEKKQGHPYLNEFTDKEIIPTEFALLDIDYFGESLDNVGFVSQK